MTSVHCVEGPDAAVARSALAGLRFSQVGGWVRGLGFSVMLDGGAVAIEPPLVLPGAQGGGRKGGGGGARGEEEEEEKKLVSSFAVGTRSASTAANAERWRPQWRHALVLLCRLWDVSRAGGAAEVGWWVWGSVFYAIEVGGWVWGLGV